MRIKFLLCFFILLSGINCFTQNTFILNIKSPYNYGTVGYDQAKNGDILFSCKVTHLGYDDLYYSRITGNGKVLWEKGYHNTTALTGSKILGTDDNGALIFAVFHLYATHLDVGTLIKCDSLGNIQWQKSFTRTDRSFTITPVQIMQDTQGNYVILYQLSTTTLGKADEIRVLKLNRKGDFKNETGVKNIYNSSQSQYYYTDVAMPTTDGGLLIGLSYECAPCDAGDASYLMLLNASGDVVFYKLAEPETISYDASAEPEYLINQNGQYILIGHLNDASLNDSKYKDYYYIVSLSPTVDSTVHIIPYNIFALKRYLNEHNISITGINKNSATVVSYYPKNTAINKGILISKYDSLNRICPDYSIPEIPSDTSTRSFYEGNEITGAKKVIDTLLIGIPTTKPVVVNVIQTECSGEAEDILGAVTINAAMSTPVIQTNFIQPNPAHSTVNVSFYADAKELYQISIVDLNGNTVQSNKMIAVQGNNSKTFDVSNLAKGFYAIKITSSTKQTVLKFIKE